MDDKEVQETEQGQVIEPVEEQPTASMPEENQKPTEATGQLPDAVSERTRQEFEKLKAHNRELANKLTKAESTQYGNSVFESVYGQKSQPQAVPPTVPFQGKQETVPNFVDANGYVDVEAQTRFLNDLALRTQHAEAEARQTRETVRQQEEKRQIKEAHEKYPWLNPSDSGQFDPTSFELVRDRLVRNMWEGREQTLAEVAEEVTKFHTPSVKAEEIKEQAVAEFKEKQTIKAQASAVQSGKGQPREESARGEELRERTRRGDNSALDERIKNI